MNTIAVKTLEHWRLDPLLSMVRKAIDIGEAEIALPGVESEA